MPRLQWISAILLSTSITFSHAQAQFRTLFLSGSQAPGLAPGVTLSSLGGRVSSIGHLRLSGRVSTSDLPNTIEGGLWIERSEGLTKIAITGDQAPGIAGGARFAGVPLLLSANDADVAVIRGGIEGPNVDEISKFGSCDSSGIWSFDEAGLRLVAQVGGAVPGFPDGTRFGCLGWNTELTSKNQIVFSADFTSDQDPKTSRPRRGVFLKGRGDQLQLIASSGQVVEDFGTIGQLEFDSLLDSTAVLVATNAERSQRAILLAELDSGIARPPIVIKGGAASEFGAQTSAGSFRILDSDSEDEMLLELRLAGPDIVSAYSVNFPSPQQPLVSAEILNDRAIVIQNVDGTRRTIARSGDPAPDTNGSSLFFAFGQLVAFDFPIFPGTGPAAINRNGEAVFFGVLTSQESNPDPTLTVDNDNGLWLASSAGDVRLLVREGDNAPGVDGVFSGLWALAPTFGDPEVLRRWESMPFESVQLNDLGQVALKGQYHHDGVSHRGLWATNENGELTLIAAPGNEIEVMPGDVRSIVEVEGHSLNESGSITVNLKFVDGSEGLFLAEHVAVPEPSGVMSVLCGAIPLFFLRRRWLAVHVAAGENPESSRENPRSRLGQGGKGQTGKSQGQLTGLGRCEEHPWVRAAIRGIS